VTLTSLQDFN